MAEEKQQLLRGVIEDEMKTAYVDYAMSVIVGRALPDAKDGLKPVHKRILYAMKELGLRYNSSYKKCARIVGEVLGKYHPHGDSAIYDSLVRMGQDFSLRYPLIDPQGNFGSVDGDSPAAMRYCVTGESLIITENGLVPVKEISDKENIDLKILSKDKKTHKASKWFDSGKHPTLRITTNKGHSLTGTYNHPVLTLTKSESGKPIFAWKLMENLEEGDVVVIDRRPDDFWPEEPLNVKKCHPKKKRKNPRTLPEILDENLAFLLGSLLAEGSLTKEKIEFCNTDTEWIQLFQDAWEKVFPDSRLHYFERNPSSYGKKDYYRLECHYRETIEFLENLGLKLVNSPERGIPHTILKSPKNVVSRFLMAFFEGDGSISYSGKAIELCCMSTSEKLMSQMQVLLLRFGIDSTKRYDRHRNLWKLYIRGQKNRFRFYKDIGFLHGHKKAKLEMVMRRWKKTYSNTDYVPFLSDFVRRKTRSEFVTKNNFDRYTSMATNYAQVSSYLLRDTSHDFAQMFEYLLEQEYLFDTITEIEEAGVRRVYSIKVESDCHSFITNGIISHNTEAKMARIADEILQDIDKETVEWRDNFDGSMQEPIVLPSKLPNLLVNGSSGIAVGMATNIPPHNLTEVCKASIAYLEDPDMNPVDLMEHVKGPDFPTGGIIAGRNGIVQAYRTGRGKVRVKSRMEVEEKKSGNSIIVTEIPYMINKSQLIEQIATSVKDGKVEGISDLRDESDRKGMRIVLELKRGANPDIVQNMLLKHTRLSTTFSMLMLALVDGEPKVLSLPQLLEQHIEHRKTIVTRRTEYDLRKAEERAHILEGLIIALNNIDPVIKLIRGADSVEDAREGLMKKFKLSEEQANAILSMQLQKLASMEQKKIKDEHKELEKQIREFKKILGSEEEVKKIIRDEYLELIEKYGDGRRTEIQENYEELEVEDLIEEEDVVVTITGGGYIKRTSIDTYKAQHRGGKGIIGAKTKEEDYLDRLFIANTHAYLLVFTDKGQVYWKKVYRIPEQSRTSRGTPIINLLKIEKDEKVQAVIPVREFDDKRYLLTATRNGIVKKTKLEAYSRPRKGGIIAMGMDNDDELVNVKLTNGNKEVILATKNGMAVRFNEKDVRPMGRTARGVIGVRLSKGDEVICMVSAEDEKKKLLTITENGYGKKTPISEYRLIKRGGKGVINIKTSKRNGGVVAVKVVDNEDEIIVISKNGIVMRTRSGEISTISRNTQGVRIMRLGENDKVVSAARIISEAEEAE